MLNIIGTTYFVMISMMNSSCFVIVILLSVSKEICLVQQKLLKYRYTDLDGWSVVGKSRWISPSQFQTH